MAPGGSFLGAPAMFSESPEKVFGRFSESQFPRKLYPENFYPKTVPRKLFPENFIPKTFARKLFPENSYPNPFPHKPPTPRYRNGGHTQRPPDFFERFSPGRHNIAEGPGAKGQGQGAKDSSPKLLEPFRLSKIHCWKPPLGCWNRFASTKYTAGILP